MDNRPIIIHAGETFVCDNGHPYATAKADIHSPHIARAKDFDFAPEQGEVKSPGPIKCNVCGGYVWAIEKHLFGLEKLGESYFNMKYHP